MQTIEKIKLLLSSLSIQHNVLLPLVKKASALFHNSGWAFFEVHSSKLPKIFPVPSRCDDPRVIIQVLTHTSLNLNPHFLSLE